MALTEHHFSCFSTKTKKLMWFWNICRCWGSPHLPSLRRTLICGQPFAVTAGKDNDTRATLMDAVENVIVFSKQGTRKKSLSHVLAIVKGLPLYLCARLHKPIQESSHKPYLFLFIFSVSLSTISNPQPRLFKDGHHSRKMERIHCMANALCITVYSI